MGTFLWVSAIRDRTAEEVVSSIRAYATPYGDVAVLTDEAPDEDLDATVVPRGSWTVVLWPNEFAGEDVAICRELSRTLRTVVSHVSIYDSDAWYHHLLREGELLDQFCSNPRCYELSSEMSPDEQEHVRQLWRGSAEIIAREVGVDAEQLRPYLIDESLLPPPPRKGLLKRALRWLGWVPQFDPDERAPKAFPDDEHTLSDDWVFVDFWRRLGIEYPDFDTRGAIRIRFFNG